MVGRMWRYMHQYTNHPPEGTRSNRYLYVRIAEMVRQKKIKDRFAIISWWCRVCWYRGKTTVDYEEITGFNMEGIRLKIEGLHRLVCEKAEVRLYENRIK